MPERDADGTTGEAPDTSRLPDELPDRISENRPSAEVAEKALVRKPQIGDTRPAPPGEGGAGGDGGNDRSGGQGGGGEGGGGSSSSRRRRRRGGRGRGGGG